MIETLAPGVFVEEIERGPRPIEGVATGTAAFLGETERGPLRPRLVASYAEYSRRFGGAGGAGKDMALAAAGFFENGGRRLFVVRIAKGGAPAAWRRGLAELDDGELGEVSLVYAPGIGDPGVEAHVTIQRALIAHCETQRFRFAVLDGPPGVVSLDALDPRATLGDSGYAAVYHPWIEVADPETGAAAAAPPGGHVLGVYARTDAARGVFKAPANEVVVGAQGLAQEIGDAGQDVLNPRGVNVIRRFSGRGIRVWGARTLSAASEWKYVPVRRLLIFLEASIHRGLDWVFFEPNAEPTWAYVRENVSQFLTEQWRAGAFQGARPNEAFYVRCDRTIMTQADIDTGRLVVEVGVAPLKPAEFVIFRIGQWTAEAQR